MNQTPNIKPSTGIGMNAHKKITKILIANRSEIAIRVMRAAAEMDIKTVAIYAEQDKLAIHRFKADESYIVGKGKPPLQAYLDIADIIKIALKSGADAIHPGYGFLSENPELSQACCDNGIIFIGPDTRILKLLGNKISARNLALDAGIPVMPASNPLPYDDEACKKIALEISYPLMLKASWGGGGRGMRVIETADTLLESIKLARSECAAAFGNDEVYLEKLVVRARHVEVQLLGDQHGNLVHLFERDCSVQRRHQKVVERAPAPYLSDAVRKDLCETAVKLGQFAKYTHAGTVEFLMDADTHKFYFIEVNPRIQVEHTVTEEITGIDIVKAQIRISEGARIGDADFDVPTQDKIKLQCHALQCRVTTEDPNNGFVPDYGTIVGYRSPAGFGVRLDGGTAYSGAVITPFYDSLLVKVTTRGSTPIEAIDRMDRALREFRVRGVTTNLLFVENVINHPLFKNGECTTKFIEETPALFEFKSRQDRASRVLKFLAEVKVNGNPEMEGRKTPAHFIVPVMPIIDEAQLKTDVLGSKQRLDQLGAKGLSQWMLDQKQVLITDTTMRDAHQSLFATRMRSKDLVKIAPFYQALLPDLFSVECWGGATFDVSMRFLKEDPWERLAALRKSMPNILLQMLVRGVNGVGYTSYPDNVVAHFIKTAALNGIDLFRVFDSLNITENMRVSMDAILDSGKLCEAAICYTADIFDEKRSKYNLAYYIKHAKALEKAGAHILAIKDMAGVCRPAAAKELFSALKNEISLPIHFHTHDTSGISAASVLAAIDAGVDAVDCAVDSLSGLTSQPSMGSILNALKGTEKESSIDLSAVNQIALYFEGVRSFYAPFESEMRSGTSDVYRHEMPGGQYTNLKEQARSLGLESKWDQVATSYATVNQMFGDIVKVTPSSKVVGDMALMMVTQDLSAEDVLNPAKEIAFPESVVGLFKGEIGIPEGGFPQGLSAKVLKGEKPMTMRPGAHLPPVDFAAIKAKLTQELKIEITDEILASYLMYPKVFTDFAKHKYTYGNVSRIPTISFFYGAPIDVDLDIEIQTGKTLLVRLLAVSEPDAHGECQVFFEINGEQRTLKVSKKGLESLSKHRPQAELGNKQHIGSPMPGMVGVVRVAVGDTIAIGDPLMVLEAMKMETILRSELAGIIKAINVKPGDVVESHDLLIELK